LAFEVIQESSVENNLNSNANLKEINAEESLPAMPIHQNLKF